MLKRSIAKGVPSAPGLIPGIYLLKLAGLAEDHGIAFERLWRQALGSAVLPREQLTDVDADYGDWLALVRILLDQVAESGGHVAGLGLRFGAAFGLPDFGILAYAMLSCRDLGQCLETFANLADLFGRIAELECRFVSDERTVAYRCTSHVVDAAAARFETETALAQFMTLRNLLADPDRFRPARVSVAFPEAGEREAYEALFRSRVHFEAEVSEVVLPRALLAERFAMANDEARRACEQQCEALHREMAASGSLASKVRELVLRSPGNIPELEDVARALHMSDRTLRRKLAAENVTFHDIVSRVREHLAKRYLRDTAMPVKEIGYLLGYSEPANFQRAFKKWVGRTPGEYRTIGDPA